MSTKKELLTAVVSIDIEINATVTKTWSLMISDIGQWWRKDFLICENSQGMTIQPKVGGLLCEKTAGDDTGYAWGQIISFQPETHLAYVAQIVPPWGGPAQSVVQISLQPGESRDTTVLTLTDSLIGHVSDDLLSGLDDGWRQLYGEGGFKTHVESN
jgi:uncharacterized protein YndB with AHSA1/START domain